MQVDNKRIAKNTLALYCRTFITMIVGLYTGRVLLEALGIDNYGIQNVVGGIISFSSIITGTMTSATSRYITFYLGKGDLNKLKTVFVTTVNTQILLASLAILILEIGGVWWLNAEANIPLNRMDAANWVLQCSIAGLFVDLVAVPYRSCIVAHEKMSIYAYMSIIEVLLKLGIVFCIINYGGDRLIFYSLLLLLVNIIMTIFYCLYSRSKFTECRYRCFIDKPLLKEMSSYSGWNLFGNTAWVLNTQGVNMLINTFFGVVYNAARGVATTVNGCVQSFIGNFTIAFTPQLTKSYAAGEYTNCYILANRGCRFTWLLMLIFIVPVTLESNTILHLWLTEVPPMSSLFLIFAVFESLANGYSSPLNNIIQATGNVKRYTVEVTSYGFLVFPLTWIAYLVGAPVWISYPIFIFIYSTLVVFRFRALSRLTSYQWKTFFPDVIIPCLICTIASYSLPLVLCIFLSDNILRFILIIIISTIWTTLCIYKIGLIKSEREFINQKIHKLFRNR